MVAKVLLGLRYSLNQETSTGSIVQLDESIVHPGTVVVDHKCKMITSSSSRRQTPSGKFFGSNGLNSDRKIGGPSSGSGRPVVQVLLYLFMKVSRSVSVGLTLRINVIRGDRPAHSSKMCGVGQPIELDHNFCRKSSKNSGDDMCPYARYSAPGLKVVKENPSTKCTVHGVVVCHQSTR